MRPAPSRLPQPPPRLPTRYRAAVPAGREQWKFACWQIEEAICACFSCRLDVSEKPQGALGNASTAAATLAARQLPSSLSWGPGGFSAALGRLQGHTKMLLPKTIFGSTACAAIGTEKAIRGAHNCSRCRQVRCKAECCKHLLGTQNRCTPAIEQ